LISTYVDELMTHPISLVGIELKGWS